MFAPDSVSGAQTWREYDEKNPNLPEESEEVIDCKDYTWLRTY